jgi:hypothetical protein
VTNPATTLTAEAASLDHAAQPTKISPWKPGKSEVFERLRPAVLRELKKRQESA